MKYWICVCDQCLRRKDFILYRKKKRKMEYTFNGIEWHKHWRKDMLFEGELIVPLLGRGAK